MEENAIIENKRSAFFKFFSHKGTIAPIVEKAYKNFDLKNDDNESLHYFAIGHTFKQLDNKAVFNYELDEDKQREVPTAFLALQKEAFVFKDKLFKLIKNIRNLNSHYIHDFNGIRISTIEDKKIIDFLKESFELAVIQIYLSETNKTFEQYSRDNQRDKHFVDFLCKKFYPLNDKFKDLNPEKQGKDLEKKKKFDDYIALREEFRTFSKEKAIDDLLFIGVNNSFQWEGYKQHKVFEIEEGEYLSIYACLFLLSMFLYKDEANKLISKIKGFKRSDDKMKSKRNIFMFFSKKCSSRDIDSEQRHLVKFRDIIQYLNHYPAVWNKDLEPESKHPIMTDVLKDKIVEMEICRSFSEFKDDDRFIIYAKYHLWGMKYLGERIDEQYMDCSFSDLECRKYGIILEKINNKQINKSKQAENRKDKPDLHNTIKKLKSRIDKNIFMKSHGRNQDRFMYFAMCFLAEKNYFGIEATFKMYSFFAIDEQQQYLEEEKAKYKSSEDHRALKKEYDKLRYHQGRLVHFCTFSDHQNKYPEWDMPFVIENNAIQVKIPFSCGIQTISIQRNLMIYLLENALFKGKENIEGTGKLLLEEYFNEQQEDFKSGKRLLEQRTDISIEEKQKLKKLFPKRLLHHYLQADYNRAGAQNKPIENSFKILLDKTNDQEKRYKALCERVKKEELGYKSLSEKNTDITLLSDFKKRNKGKKFKLQFIRKAWHIMYFKDIYIQEKERQKEYEKDKIKNAEHEKGHHKKFHITKEEFDDFSRWMYAFDQNSQYKCYLRVLFESKNFLKNENFKVLFENSTSLDDLYYKTKKEYSLWIDNNNGKTEDKEKYKIDRYQYINDTENAPIFYINISHFIHFLKALNDGRKLIEETVNNKPIIQYRAQKNIKYLIDFYYYKPRLEREKQKEYRCLYNKLRTAQLEDALLYEIAMKYIEVDKRISDNIRENVTEIFHRDIVFDIKNERGEKLYQLVVPFRNIDSFLEMLTFKKQQIKYDYLENVHKFLTNNKYKYDVKRVIKNLCVTYNNNRKLKYADLTVLNGYLIDASIEFTKILMELECFFIYKNKIKKDLDKPFIKMEKIDSLLSYRLTEDRNNALHFDFPSTSYSYEAVNRKIENKFIKEEVLPSRPKNYQEIQEPLKIVCTRFLDILHDNCFDRKIKDGGERRKSAENKYFNTKINL